MTYENDEDLEYEGHGSPLPRSEREHWYRSDHGARAMRSVVRAHVDEHLHLRPRLASMMERSTWCIDRIEWGEASVEIRGWALPPADGYFPATFTINGECFEEIDFPRSRPDIGGLFWFRPGADLSGFVCRSPRKGRDFFEGGHARLDFADARTLRPFREEHAFYGLDPHSDQYPLPHPDQRIRVHGNRDADSFRTQGSSAFIKLEQALDKSAGRRFADFHRILDWGCGCGRVARWFAGLSGCELVGIDIDEKNVKWCREHLPFASFGACGVDPPTSLESSSIDLVIGISVMTHLREDDRFAWLKELARVCRPGAIALLTTQGRAAVCRASFGVSSLAAWQQSGAFGKAISSAARDLSPEPDRYIDCFLREEYIRDRWNGDFEVVDVIPAYIGNVQDLVILRKPE